MLSGSRSHSVIGYLKNSYPEGKKNVIGSFKKKKKNPAVIDFKKEKDGKYLVLL